MAVCMSVHIEGIVLMAESAGQLDTSHGNVAVPFDRSGVYYQCTQECAQISNLRSSTIYQAGDEPCRKIR